MCFPPCSTCELLNSEVLCLRKDRYGHIERSILIGPEWSTSKMGPTFWKRFRLNRADPFSIRPTFAEMSVEWIVPLMCTLKR